MSGALSLRAAALDAADPLAKFRRQFAHPVGPDDRTALYLCGHSLGLMPMAARDRVQEELDDWARLGVAGHHAARRDWIGYAERFAPALAALAGAAESEVTAMNGLSVNLHLLLASFYRPEGRRRCIVIEAGAFPSDRHAVASQIQWHGLAVDDALIELAPEPGTLDCDETQLEQLLETRGEEIALVLWPGVQYLSGRAFDLSRIAHAARCAGAYCGFGWHMPSATCRCSCMMMARISPSGAVTNTSTPDPARSPAPSCMNSIHAAACRDWQAGGDMIQPRVF